MRIVRPALFGLGLLGVLGLLGALAGCGGSSDSSPTAPATDTDPVVSDVGTDTATSADSGSPASDAGTDASGADVGRDATGATDASSATDGAAPTCATGCATLAGKVMRVALTKPQNGGKGPVYVAVFDKDPVVDRAGAKLVGQTKIDDCDLTADTASVPYSIASLPPRADPYFVVAFLDDNKNAGGATPGPDKGDLVSLDGLAAPKVTLKAGGATVTLDIPLNAVLPF